MQSNDSETETKTIERSWDYDAKVLSFIAEIGIEVDKVELEGPQFLPGLKIEKGLIYMDPLRILSIGDLLHEAGHIAITESVLRPFIGTEKMAPEWPTPGDEIVTILWSYAAASHLTLPLDILFHPHGYKGESEWLITSFSSGEYVGLPLLEWMGMCYSEGNQPDGTEAFPKMMKWLRD